MTPDTLASECEFRRLAWHGEDITVPPKDRGDGWRWKAWTRWRRVEPSWAIAGCRVADLGGAWTDENEWRIRA